MAYSRYINLYVHSEYSFERGFFSIKDYVKFAVDNGINVLCLSECSNLFSAVKFYNECVDNGIKPILGCEVFIEDDFFGSSKVLLLCKSVYGYRNLVKIVSKSYLENESNDVPVIKKKWLIGLSNGLIAVSLSYENDFGYYLFNNDFFMASKIFKFWQSVFINSYYLSLTNSDLNIEGQFLNTLLSFSEEYDAYLVFINEVCYLRESDYDSFKSKLAIFNLSILNDDMFSSSVDIEKDFSSSYFKFDEDVVSDFINYPEFLQNGLEISIRCNLILDLFDVGLPKCKSYENICADDYLIMLTLNGLIERLDVNDFLVRDVYLSRLKSEFSVISHLNFIDYFLITYDFINYAKNSNVLVGPSRGSGGGSLVAYFLYITSIDPIKYNLLFERFLNKDRLSSPDFDVDFCIEGRDFIMDYVYDAYGIHSVAQIVTFGSFSAKAVVRDVGRILGYPFIFIDRIARLISNNLNVTLKDELDNNSNLKVEYKHNYEVKSIIDLSLKLENLVRSIGKHAGGVVIGPRDLMTCIPLYYNCIDKQCLTQFDKYDLEKFGLIKFDFLGLKTLTILDSVSSSINSFLCMFSDDVFDIYDISLRDISTYFLLQRSNTIGVFQLESRGIKNVVRRFLPKSFEDIIALVALYRPGPLKSGMLNEFINRKLGKETIDYMHPILESILNETYGVIVYQEQVMQIAQLLSGYSLAMADLLRIAMSKKKIVDMSSHFDKFVSGAIENRVDENLAKDVFYLIEKFAGYGFNKSHSVGYALLAYQTAWLKSNYVLLFMSALLSSEMRDHKKLYFYIRECRNFGIKLYLPDINRSFNCFSIINNGIIYGFGAIKGVGDFVISDIIENRCCFGHFKGFFDFLDRSDLSKFTKRVLISLVYSGCFNNFSIAKLEALVVIKKIYNFSKICFNKKLNQISFFSDFYFFKKNIYVFNDFFKIFDLRFEKTLLGWYISFDILKMFDYEFKNLCKFNCKNYVDGFSRESFVGFVLKFKFFKFNNRKFVLLVVNNFKSNIEIFMSSLVYNINRKSIKYNNIIVSVCYLFRGKYYAIFFKDFRVFRLQFVRFFEVIFDSECVSNLFLKFIFDNFRDNISYGKCLLLLKCYYNGDFKSVTLCSRWAIYPSDYLIDVFFKFKEVLSFRFIY